jgi:hypothetical protein
LACNPGQFSAPGDTACQACPAGQYRLAPQPDCLPCQEGWFAPDAAQAVCVRCNTTCEPGQYDAGVCPGASTNFIVCAGCAGGLPGNASWSTTSLESCTYDCLPGFYHADGGCKVCTSRTCEAGRRYTPCTATSDSHCDVLCEDSAKPAFHSHWENGCSWVCDAGYELRVWDYVMFTLRECALTG